MFKTRAVFRVVIRLALSLCAAVFLLAGCSIVRQPSSEEYESVRQNQKAIVLFRLTGSLDGKEVHPLAGATIGPDLANRVNLLFGLANMEVGEPVSKFSTGGAMPSWIRTYGYFSPSSESAENGWGVFLLEPGTYYFSITSGAKGVVEPIPQFRFIVPPNTPLVYIGSVHVACTTFENTGYYGGRGFAYGSCFSDAKAANEMEAASVIAQASFKDFGTPLSAIMQRYDFSPLAPGNLVQVAPVGLLVPRSEIEVGSPEWMKRAMAIGLMPSAALVVLTGGYGAGFGLLWAPVGTVLGYLGGKWSESSWEPCRQGLQESLGKFNPAAALATKLKAALDQEEVQTLDAGMEDSAREDFLGDEVKSILNAQITRMALRFCSPTLCLDVATHVTLFDLATQTYLYDRVLVYSSAQLELQPYELSVSGSTTAFTGRALETYCKEGGGEILQGDLSDALDATVYRVIQELGLTPE